MISAAELLVTFRKGTDHLVRMAEGLDYPWSPECEDPRQLHNVYVRNLVTCYVSKFAQLSETLIDSVEKNRYLIYALTGRSLLEIVATLRYYLLSQYKPILDTKLLKHSDMTRLIEIDDRHLRGSRFDWESFFFKRYADLTDDARKQLIDKKARPKTPAELQVNVLTCVEKWAQEKPEVLVAYNLFCELVHPNMGSSFLIASTNDRGLFFSSSKGAQVGRDIFEQSFPILASVTHKPFGELLVMLLATMWSEEELKA